jgi:hypothetical protein
MRFSVVVCGYAWIKKKTAIAGGLSKFWWIRFLLLREPAAYSAALGWTWLK